MQYDKITYKIYGVEPDAMIDGVNKILTKSAELWEMKNEVV
jgi:hypothetical protein